MIAFGVASIVVLVSGLMAVQSTNLVRAVLWLGLSLLGTAGIYATMDAGFLAAIQVLLYTGGVVTLMLFAVMLSKPEASGLSDGRVRAGLAAGIVGAGVVSVILRSAPGGEAGRVETEALGALILGDLMLPFELLSVLLLAAMIGAIVLARRTDP